MIDAEQGSIAGPARVTETVDATGASKAAMRAVELVLGGGRARVSIVSDAGDVPAERFVVVPARGIPRLLLPVAGRPMRAALQSFLGPRAWTGVAPSLLRASARFAPPRLAVSRSLSLHAPTEAPAPLRELFASLLNREDFQLAMRLSFGRPNAKTVIAAIADDGEALCFAKFGSEAMTDALVRHEGGTLERLSSGTPVLRTPRVLHAGDWTDGIALLVTEPMRLEPLGSDTRAVHRAADALACTGDVSRSTLGDSPFWRDMRARLAGAPDTLQQTVAELERRWGDDERDFGASHGDWSRANVGLVDGRVAAIDWERYTGHAPRGIDTAHFAMLEVSSRRRGQPIDVARITRATASYLDAAERPATDAPPLVAFALLEMVARFHSAGRAGVATSGTAFEHALHASVRNDVQ